MVEFLPDIIVQSNWKEKESYRMKKGPFVVLNIR